MTSIELIRAPGNEQAVIARSSCLITPAGLIGGPVLIVCVAAGYRRGRFDGGGRMSSGPDMAYSSAGMRTGGGLAGGAGERAQAARGAMGGVEVPAAALGVVQGAAELAVALARAGRAQAALCGSVAACHVDLDGRSGQVAGMGEQLDVDTAAIAASASPGR